MEMVKREKVKEIVTFFFFMVICILSTLCVSMFISGYLVLVFSGGCLSFSVIWLLIYANRKYRVCDFHLSIFPILSRIVYLLLGLSILFRTRVGYEPGEIESVIGIGIALVMFSISLFSKTLKTERVAVRRKRVLRWFDSWWEFAGMVFCIGLTVMLAIFIFYPLFF